MISSTANSRVKHVVQLREKGRERKKEGVFLAEGIRMFQETPASRIRELYIEETLAERPQTEDFSEKSKPADRQVFSPKQSAVRS